MKIRYTLAILLLAFTFNFCSQSVFAQGMWTCMQNCDSNQNIYYDGNAGARQVPSTGNYPPEALYRSTWVDTAGNFWVYGGEWWTDASTAMFMFNPNTLEWTWTRGKQYFLNYFHYVDTFKHMGLGVYDSLNSPGPTMGPGYTWVTPNNHLWLYAGTLHISQAQSMGNDLWQYDPVINQWAWMGQFAISPSNFGMYPIDTVNTIVYGARGTGTALNTPGHRGHSRFETGAAWTDANGNLWMFGGRTYNVPSPGMASGGRMVRDSGYLADMWKYDVNTAIWTWMSGSNILDDPGHYGSLGVPSVNNYPAARVVQNFWTDDSGNFWMAGGFGTGPDTNLYSNHYEDIWKFNPNTLEWTWIKGPAGPTTLLPSGITCDTSALNNWGPHCLNNFVWKLNDDIIITYESKDSLELSDPGGLDYPRNNLIAYSVSSNTWVPLAEYSLAGNYGVTGLAASTNVPYARTLASGFVDKNKNCWLLGGRPAFNLNSSLLAYNDVWKYIPDTACLRRFSSQLILSTTETSKPLQFDVVPNPTTGNIKLTLQQATGTGGMVEVLNTLGQTIYTTGLGTGTTEKHIQLPAVNSGIYFVRLTVDKQQTTQKLIITH